jgi:hypothetical protein
MLFWYGATHVLAPLFNQSNISSCSEHSLHSGFSLYYDHGASQLLSSVSSKSLHISCLSARSSMASDIYSSYLLDSSSLLSAASSATSKGVCFVYDESINSSFIVNAADSLWLLHDNASIHTMQYFVVTSSITDQVSPLLTSHNIRYISQITAPSSSSIAYSLDCYSITTAFQSHGHNGSSGSSSAIKTNSAGQVILLLATEGYLDMLGNFICWLDSYPERNILVLTTSLQITLLAVSSNLSVTTPTTTGAADLDQTSTSAHFGTISYQSLMLLRTTTIYNLLLSGCSPVIADIDTGILYSACIPQLTT